MNSFLKITLSLGLSFSPLFLYAAPFNDIDSSYQEVTYEDLLNELHGQKKKITQSTQMSPLDEVKIHMGLGLMSSITHFDLSSKNFERFQNGMVLSLGIDLFSTSWYSECQFKNYGLTSRGTEDLVLRELDLLLGYKHEFNPNLGYFLKSGLSNRYLKYTDPTQHLEHDESSPNLLLSTGLNINATPSVGVSLEISGQSALVQSTSQKNAIEFAVRLNTSL